MDEVATGTANAAACIEGQADLKRARGISRFRPTALVDCRQRRIVIRTAL